MRKKSKNPLRRAKERADRELQESYRRNFPFERCEVCSRPFNLMHHHIEKSQNLFTRYLCPENLIFLCSNCHNQIHFYNRDPVSAYSIKRGKNWQKEIVELRKKRASYGIKKIKEISDYYKLNIPEKYGNSKKVGPLDNPCRDCVIRQKNLCKGERPVCNLKNGRLVNF